MRTIKLIGVRMRKNINPIIIGAIILPRVSPNFIQTVFKGFNNFIVSTSANLSGKKVLDNPLEILDFFESDELAYYDGELGHNKRPSKIIDLDSKSIIRD